MVRGGDWDLSSENETFPHVDQFVQEIIMHPNYDNDNLFNDVALLQLKEVKQLFNRKLEKRCNLYFLSSHSKSINI